MPGHENDARFSLFGSRERARTETLTRCDDGATPEDDAGKSRTVWDGDAVDDPGDIEFDRTWHVLLIQTLSRLEYGRAALADTSSIRDPGKAVGVAAAMVSQLSDFIAAQVDPLRHRRALEDSLAAAGRFLTAAQVATRTAPRRGLFGFLGPRSIESSAQIQECMWVLRDMPLVLERFFALLGSCFRSQKFALDWVDTSGVYLTELKGSLSWVEGFAG
jgi:hypothetical protein